MSDRDEIIRAQTQIIGILMEIVKRFTENGMLDEEYFALVAAGKNSDRMREILKMRQNNSEAISRLLSQLES